MARIEDLFPNGEPPPATPVADVAYLPPRTFFGLKTLKIPSREKLGLPPSAPPPASTPASGGAAPAPLPAAPMPPGTLPLPLSPAEEIAALERAFGTIPEEPPPLVLPLPPAPLPPVVVAVQEPVHELELLPADQPLPMFCYISGPAGTGKTWLARKIVKERDDAILTATTGIAAVNLGDASTINSVLAYYNTQSLLEHYASGFLQTRLRQLRKSGIRTIVLDEVSMLDADQLTALCQAMDEVNFSKDYDASLGAVTFKEHDSGTMNLILVGDFAQLPPVEAKFAFESPEWKRFAGNTIKLEKIRRQGDQRFVEALQAVRKGQPSLALPVFEPRMVPSLDFDFAGTTIVAKNDEVDRINKLRFEKLAGAEFEWPTIRSGEQEPEWLKQIPEKVFLKPGALVMILANRPYPKLDDEDLSRGFVYVNGDLATVLQKEANGVRVMLHRTYEEVLVVPAVSEKKVATGKKNPRWDIKGTVTRMPLRLAYATTVHKCVSGDTLVPVHGKGYIPIDRAAVGDTTPFGKILGWARSTRPAYRITTKRGYTVVASAEHLWLTREGWRETQYLQPGMGLELNPGIPFPGDPTSLTWEQAWVLGAIVGDGCYTDVDDGTVEFSCTNEEFGERFRLVAEQAFEICPKWRKDCRGLTWTHQRTRQGWKAWGLDYVKAPAKTIPWIVWTADPRARGGFLSGLFDTGGHVGRQRIVLTTASEMLAKEVQEMLLTLGIVSKRSSYPGVEGSTYWQIYIAAECRDRFLQRVGFVHVHKAQRAADHRPNRSLRPSLGYDKVREVIALGEERAMCDVELEAPHTLPFGPFLGHNSQGLSLDQVQISMVSWMFGKPGMLYVALSRCRSLEGLRIIGNPKMFLGKCSVEPKIGPFL